MNEKPGLKEIEQALTRLWTRRADRESFLAGTSQNDADAALFRHIDPRGVKIYANLIDLNRLDLMASIYPHCKKLLGKNFRAIVLDYMETMPPDHFNFNQAARKFPQFMAEHAEVELRKKPFLAELADYEWIELAVLENDAEIEFTAVKNPASATVIDPVQFAQTVPRLNPTVVLRAYRYPISKIVDALEEDVKLPRRQKLEASYVLAFRNPEHLCEYLEISELTYILLSALEKNNKLTYGEMIAMACEGASDPEATVTDFLAMLEQLAEDKVFL